MKTLMRREPFYGLPEDRDLLGTEFKLSESAREFVEPGSPLAELLPKAHPDAVEKGTELALGFMPHRGENRTTRRAAVANWQPPKVAEGETPPTRRELWKQRQKHRRGKLDPELRRMQRERLK